MRLSLVFDLKENCLNRDYRRVFTSFLKNALVEAKNTSVFKAMYEEGVQEKPFTFTVILPSGTEFVANDLVKLSRNQATMVVSVSDKDNLGLFFMSTLIGQKGKKFKMPLGNSMVLKRVDIKEDIVIRSDKAVFETMLGTSMCVRNHMDHDNKQDEYLIFSDPDFSEIWVRNTTKQLERAGFDEKDVEGLMITPIDMKETSFLHYLKYVKGSSGSFLLTGKPKVLNYLYSCGVGSRSAQGFGCIELMQEL